MSADEVVVVYAALDVSPNRLAELAQHLSIDERARAARFAFERDRDRFIAGRGILRELLGARLGERPESLVFRYGKRGKPMLVEDAYRFNVSHAHGRAAYVFSEEREVGVDLERIRPLERIPSLADQLFTERECTALALLDDEDRQAEFFRVWTRREAYGKATGEGLFSDSEVEAGWSVTSLEPAPGFAAALAVAGTGWQLREGPWPIEGDGNER